MIRAVDRRASGTSASGAGGVSFGLSSGKECDVDGQILEIAGDGVERGFDPFVASFGVTGDGVERGFDPFVASFGITGDGVYRGFDPLDPLVVPTFGAFAEVHENRDDDSHGGEDDADDSDPFLAGHVCFPGWRGMG